MTDLTEREILRGKDAADLLANPLLVESFGLMEQDIFERFKECPTRDLEGLQALRQRWFLLEQLQAQLQQVVSTGQFAQASLARRTGQKLKAVFSR